MFSRDIMAVPAIYALGWSDGRRWCKSQKFACKEIKPSLFTASLMASMRDASFSGFRPNICSAWVDALKKFTTGYIERKYKTRTLSLVLTDNKTIYISSAISLVYSIILQSVFWFRISNSLFNRVVSISGKSVPENIDDVLAVNFKNCKNKTSRTADHPLLLVLRGPHQLGYYPVVHHSYVC